MSLKNIHPVRLKLTSLKLRILCSFFRNKTNVTVNILGLKISGYNYNCIYYLFKEIILSEEYNFTSLKEQPKIIDCGANIGMATLYFKMLYPDAVIQCFEPNPEAFSFLKQNIQENKLSNVTLHNFGLGLNNEMLDFYFSSGSSLTGSLIKTRGGENKVQVNIKRLSDFILSDDIDLIKIDVEGHEFPIIQDLANEIS